MIHKQRIYFLCLWFLFLGFLVLTILGFRNLGSMSCLNAGFSVSGSTNLIINHRGKGDFRVSSSIRTLEFKESNTKEIWGKTLNFSDQRGLSNLSIKAPNLDPVQVILYPLIPSCFFKFL